MSDEDEFERIFEELRTARDELRVQMHLAKAEIRDEWEEELEPKFQEAERKLEGAAEETRQVINVIAAIDIDRERAAKTESELTDLGADVEFIIADLSKPGDLNDVLATLVSSVKQFDVCIHNAGINVVGQFSRTNMANQQRVIDLNMQTPLLMTAGLLARSVMVRGGSFVFISSSSSYPGAAVYAATKHGIASYAGSLRAVSEQTGVNVLTAYPGPTRTRHARKHSPDNRREHKRMSPDILANRIFSAEQKGRPILYPGVNSQLTALLGTLLPQLTEKVMRITVYDKMLSGDERQA